MNASGRCGNPQKWHFLRKPVIANESFARSVAIHNKGVSCKNLPEIQTLPCLWIALSSKINFGSSAHDTILGSILKFG